MCAGIPESKLWKLDERADKVDDSISEIIKVKEEGNMDIKKKAETGMVITAIAGLVICMSLYICNRRNTEPAEKKLIAVSTIGPTHGWAKAVDYYAEKELEKVAQENDWEYICREANDANEQSRQVEEMLTQGIDCLIMLPMDGASLKTAGIAVQSADVPLVIFDREIPEFAPMATVKGDNKEIGAATARYFNHYFSKGTLVLEMMGDTSTVPFLRSAGYDEVINEKFSKIQVGYTEWQRAYSRELFRQWISKQEQELLDQVGAVFTHDDEIALGVLDVLDEPWNEKTVADQFPNLKVIAGSSGSQEMYQRIREEDRWTLFSMTYSPEMIAQAVDTGAAIIKGKEYEEMKIVPTVCVDKSNVEKFLDENSPFK